MSNIIRLPSQEVADIPPPSPMNTAEATGHVLSFSLQLCQSATRVMERLDAIDAAVHGVGDTEAQRALKHVTAFARNRLIDLMFKLKTNVELLPRS